MGVGIEYDNQVTINLAITFLSFVINHHNFMQLEEKIGKWNAIPNGYFKEIPHFFCKNVY